MVLMYRRKCSQLAFSDFMSTHNSQLSSCVQIISIFSFYKNLNYDLSILYHKKTHYIQNFDTKSLPSKDIQVALLIPYSCPTPNLPYSSIREFETYKKFWQTQILEPCYKKGYFYDPKHALGLGKRWGVYGKFEIFEQILKGLLESYKDIIISTSFWNQHGFYDISNRFRNKLFKKRFPTLDWAMGKRTVCFNHPEKKQRIHKVFKYFEKTCHFRTLGCPLPPLYISGVIDWEKDFETIEEYLKQGGDLKWALCKEMCKESCPDPSIVTMCPDYFVKSCDNKKIMQILVGD